MSRIPAPSLLLLASAALASAAPAVAQQTPVDSARVHTVRPGDTLWDLARRYLGDPYLWPEIFELNRARVADPHRIYPAERLRIPASEAGAVAEPGSGPARSVFFRPEQASGAGVVDADVVARPPLVTSGEYHRAGVLMHDRDVGPVGEVAAVPSHSVVPMQTDPQVHPFNRVYVRVTGRVAVGDRLHLLRRAREVPPYGRVYESTGMGTVAALEGATATLVVDQLYGQVRRGDVAVPMGTLRTPEEGTTRAGGPSGRVLAFQREHPVPQLHELLFVDLGRQFGVKEGDEFEAYLPARQESWGVRPEVVVARLRAVRVAPRTATVQVIGLEQPALAPGMPVRLVARAP